MGGNIKSPGTKQGLPMNHNHVLELITDELEALESVGCNVFDAHRGKQFQCYAKLLALTSDYRGLQKHVGIKGSPALTACFKCWIHGHRVGHKTVFANHFTWLPEKHPLRAVLCKRHTNGGRKWPILAVRPRDRSVIEMRGALPEPTSVMEYAFDPSELPCPLYRLAYFNPVLGIQYDGMHTIGGVIKDTVVKGLQGLRTDKASTAVREYDQGNHVTTNAGKACEFVLFLVQSLLFS